MAIQLAQNDFDRLVAILSQHGEWQSVRGRIDFMGDVFAGSPRKADLLTQLDLDGAPRGTAVRVIQRLATFGHDEPGREALGLLINKLIAYLGGGEDADFLRDVLVSVLSHDQLIAVLTRLPVGEPTRSSIKALCASIAAEKRSPPAPQTAFRNAQQEPPRSAPPGPATVSRATADRAPKAVTGNEVVSLTKELQALTDIDRELLQNREDTFSISAKLREWKKRVAIIIGSDEIFMIEADEDRKGKGMYGVLRNTIKKCRRYIEERLSSPS